MCSDTVGFSVLLVYIMMMMLICHVHNIIFLPKMYEGWFGWDGLIVVSDVDRVERFRLTLRFFDDVSTAS